MSAHLPRLLQPAGLTQRPALRDVLELLKPLTWFAPVWAYICGIVSAGVPMTGHWLAAALGLAIAGPLVCGTSQAWNDWFDRHVDAVNEPHRPIPSGRIPGSWGLYIGLAGMVFSLAVGAWLGPVTLAAVAVGLMLAWVYSAPPLRLKQSGWVGPAAVAACYEGLPWFTGAAVMLGHLPGPAILLILALYSVGAHGIMTLNDFKAVEGDRLTGVQSLPVVLGVAAAARLACAVMAAPQAIVIALLFAWGAPWHAAIIALGLSLQLVMMRTLLADPRAKAPWYNATGTSLYVLGMLVAAHALSTFPRGV
jgi:chlorophyll/bacteriochlorophyll a synthase